MRRSLTLLTLFVLSSLGARNLSPWFSESFEFEPELDLRYQQYDRVSATGGPIFYASNDFFADLSLGMTILGNWNVEVELGSFSTRAHSYNFEYGSLTGRTLLFDDVSGQDFASVALGITLTAPMKEAIFDPSTFHHWYFDGELHLAIGKERTCGSTWAERGYLLFGYGCGTRGSGWLRALAQVEKNLCDRHHFRFNVLFLRGLGQNQLTTLFPFPGYASLQHQSLDLGIGYSYIFFPWGTASLDYTQRVSSRNNPQNAKSITLSFLLPFSL